MNEAAASAQCRLLMPPATPMPPDPEILACKLADILGGTPDRALAERVLALCSTQIAAARPALERVDAMDVPSDHAAALHELASHG